MRLTPSSRARVAACIGPPPPLTTIVRSRGSCPRWIVTSFNALIMFASARRITAAAAATMHTCRAGAIGSCSGGQARGEPHAAAGKPLGSMTPVSTTASVTVGSLPPRP